MRWVVKRCPRTVFAVSVVAISASAYPSPDLHAQGAVETPIFLLSRPLSVRSAGMNGAGAALVGHAGAVFSNPAGIATIRNVGLEGAYRSTPSGGNISSAALAWRLRQFDLGFGVARFKPGSEPGSLPLRPGSLVDPGAREFAAVGSLVYRFGIIALAGSGKQVRRENGGVRESAVGADAGLAIAVFDIMAIGFSMQNVGGRWGGDSTVSMPRLTRVGMMWNYVDPLETVRLLSTVEFQWPEDEDFRIVVGGEGGVVVGDVGIFARAAYVTESPWTIFSNMTYGGSLTVARLALDYAYQKTDLHEEPAHRFGFRLTI